MRPSHEALAVHMCWMTGSGSSLPRGPEGEELPIEMILTWIHLTQIMEFALNQMPQ